MVLSEPALPVTISVFFQKDSVFFDGFTPISQIIYDNEIWLKYVEEVAYYHKLRGKERLLNNREGLEYKAAKKIEEELGNDGFIPFTVNNLMFPVYFS